MTLERILSDIQSADRLGKTSISFGSYAMFSKRVVNALKEYGFYVSLCTNKTSGKHWMRVAWNRRDG